MNWEKTVSLIPDGVQTLSKMPSKHVNSVYPKYIDSGKDAYIYAGEQKYVDYPLGLGPVILGHADKRVNRAVWERMEKGVLFPLPNYLETEVAEMLCDYIPCAEMVRFVKTGSEATSAAVKIARAYTGKDIVCCIGYHGWHDWYNVTTPKNKGVPADMAKFCRQFKYNELKPIQDYLEAESNVAAVILEPYVYDEPKNRFLHELRKLCNRFGVVLIFDEVVTGFRSLGGTAQKMFKVTPDLCAIGKSLGNGYPVGAVCGKKELMKVLEGDCFVSSTFGGELSGLAAAKCVLEIIRNEPVIESIFEYGQKLKNIFNRLADGLDAECIGYPCRTFFKFPTEEHKGLFWQECLKKGVFFGYAQFVSYSHGTPELDITERAMAEAFKKLRHYWQTPEVALEGDAPQQTFRLVAAR